VKRNPVLEILAEEDLQAIPSTYRVPMRSRLECRWAVWLDVVGVPWEYEPAPIRLDGRNRWPDFWLPREGVWLEIKPAWTPINVHMALSVEEQTGSKLFWVAGPPRFGDYRVSLCDFGGLDVVEGLCFGLGRRDKTQLWLAAPDLSVCFPLPPREMRLGDDVPRLGCERLKQAYLLAMSWQFEEG
jgi:hypothetical protein